jgi:membrane peptidoglycan carboxypeptidase
MSAAVPEPVAQTGVESGPGLIKRCRSVRRWLVCLLAVATLLGLASWEMRSSTLQSLYLARWASRLHYELQPGPSSDNRYPQAGPLDERLGYTHLSRWIDRLSQRGFEVRSQAYQSPILRNFLSQGFFAPFDDKNQAGLELRDCRGEVFFRARFPRHVYAASADVPQLVAQTLAFIENKELLNPAAPRSNPALEWKRLGRAVLDRTPIFAEEGHVASGGSTLATQLEKFRHSPQGRTASVKDKYRQMVSASVRAYQDGEETVGARERILLDYLNGLPLGARRGYGEVNGLLDGLHLWWGTDPNAANAVLHTDAGTLTETQRRFRARAYRQVLSLLIAQRRPSFYLGAGQARLAELTDSYLRLLAEAGVIEPGLRDAALQTTLTAQEGMVSETSNELGESRELDRPTDSSADRKAASAVRIELAGLLELPRLYDLDRLDLSATSTLDSTLQTTVTHTLRQLRTPEAARHAGLVGEHLLAPDDDPTALFYSFTLYESKDGVNRLRVQTDNLDQPFDINTGAKLELGSTAKLRTLISYLEIVAELHHQLADLSVSELARKDVPTRDKLAQWAVQHLRTSKDKTLPVMLDAAMQRRYSAHPGEVFFTGGGSHTFANFKPEDNARSFTVAEAFKDSVNLVFIRLMRDVVNHTLVQGARPVDRILADIQHTERRALLLRFADEESSRLLRGYYRRYRGQTPTQLDELLVASRSKSGPRLSALELWVLEQLRQEPSVSMARLIQDSHDDRLAAYDWLLRLRDRNAQNNRIATELERQAFVEIHRAWQRLGYPFDRLVPSYASAIGSAGDRPAALAELMGIIVNEGWRLPTAHLEDLHFASGTPFEAVLHRQAPRAGERVMAPEVVAVVRQALGQVVAQGTARRLNGAIKGNDGKPLAVGGKTGTGDNRLNSYNPRGGLIGSRAINRTATFVFFIGSRHFGTLTAYVPGEAADSYSFTSALPVQIVKQLAPVLGPVVSPPVLSTSGPTGESRAPGSSSCAGPAPA